MILNLRLKNKWWPESVSITSLIVNNVNNKQCQFILNSASVQLASCSRHGRLPMIWLAVASSRGAAFTGSQQEAAAMVLEAAGCWTTIQQQFAWTAPSVKVEMTFDLRPSSLSNTALTVTCWLAALAPLIEQNRKEGLYEAHSGEMCMITVVWCKKEGNSIYLKEGN